LSKHLRIAVGAFDGRKDLVERDFDGRLRFRIEVQLYGLVVRIAWLEVPVLAFTPIRRQPQRSAICKVKLLVDVEDGLHVVVAGVEIRKRAARITKSMRVNHDWRARLKRVYVDAKALRRGNILGELHARLRLVCLCKHEYQMARDGLRDRRDGHLN